MNRYEAGDVRVLAFLLRRYYLRGRHELVHRVLKDFGSEQVPFHRLTTTVWYYCLLTAFTLYEAFKRDLASDAILVTCYPTCFRLRLVDRAAKVVTASGRRLLREAQAAYDHLGFNVLWERVQQPASPPALA